MAGPAVGPGGGGSHDSLMMSSVLTYSLQCDGQVDSTAIQPHQIHTPSVHSIAGCYADTAKRAHDFPPKNTC